MYGTQERWPTIRGHRQSKGLLRKPSEKKNWGIAQSEEKQLRIMMGLLTGHFHLKGHLFKFGLINSPESDCCKQASDTASHVLCDCEALATLRFRLLRNQVTLKTSLSARYCTLFKVLDCRMNELKGCTKDR